MDRQDNARSQIAEKIVKTDYEVSNIQISQLIIAKENNRLDKDGINKFLQHHEKREEVLSLLDMLNKQKNLLPDFIVLDCANKISFVEVKSRKKVTLASTEQKRAIKTLADKGYNCIIKNVQIPSSENMSDVEIEKTLREYGQIMKGNSKGVPISYLNFLKEDLQSKPYPNVSIWNLIVNLNKGG